MLLSKGSKGLYKAAGGIKTRSRLAIEATPTVHDDIVTRMSRTNKERFVKTSHGERHVAYHFPLLRTCVLVCCDLACRASRRPDIRAVA
jgi:hypothetical protein